MNKIIPLICLLFLLGCATPYPPAGSHDVFDEYYDFDKLQSEFGSISNRFHKIELELIDLRNGTGVKGFSLGIKDTHKERLEKLESRMSTLASLIVDLQNGISELNSSVSLSKSD